MAVKAIITKCLFAEPNQVNGNLILTWEVAFVGPEILDITNGAVKTLNHICRIETDGTDTLAQLGTKLTDCAIASSMESIGVNIARTNVYLPSYSKGI